MKNKYKKTIIIGTFFLLACTFSKQTVAMDMEFLEDEAFITGLTQYAHTIPAYQEALKSGEIQENTSENLNRKEQTILKKQKQLEDEADRIFNKPIRQRYGRLWGNKKPTEEQKMENYCSRRNELLEKDIIIMQQQDFLERQNRQQTLSWLQRKYPNYVKDCCSRWQKRQELQRLVRENLLW